MFVYIFRLRNNWTKSNVCTRCIGDSLKYGNRTIGRWCVGIELEMNLLLLQTHCWHRFVQCLCATVWRVGKGCGEKATSPTRTTTISCGRRQQQHRRTRYDYQSLFCSIDMWLFTDAMLANMNPMTFMMGMMTMMMTDPSMVETAKLVMTKNSSNGTSSPQQNGAVTSQQQQQYSRDMALRAQRARVREIYEGPALPPDPQIGIFISAFGFNYTRVLICQVPTMATQDDRIYSVVDRADRTTTTPCGIDQRTAINRHLRR